MRDIRQHIISSATPIFAELGFYGTNVRAIAKAAGINISLISYHFGGKEGLYAAVLSEQFAGFQRIAAAADTHMEVDRKFEAYLYECGVCFHLGHQDEFTPHTASADHGAPECPRCLTNDATLFTIMDQTQRKAS